MIAMLTAGIGVTAGIVGTGANKENAVTGVISRMQSKL
jgi:hypothetical protein